MHVSWKFAFFALPLSFGVTSALLSAQIPPEIATSGAILTTLHAEGAQVYECAAEEDGKLSWKAREPIATLFERGETVGRHYAGPRWEYVDGSVVRAKVASSAPGASENDIPWLRLLVVDHQGEGKLSQTTKIQRINTRGGVAIGNCDELGTFRSVPYSADYVFLGND